MSEREINVEPLSGFRDFGQKEQAWRRWLIERAFSVYSRFGYFPIETPALEKAEVLNGQYGEEGDQLRYVFTDRGERRVGLRYDLTIPFARFLARFLPKGEVQLPYRRSQAAPVWRADSPQAGRYREFYQCDFDLAGLSGPSADAEVLQVAAALLRSLGAAFVIRVSHRGVLDALLRRVSLVGEPANRQAMLLLDKLDKVERGEIALQLQSKAGLSAQQAQDLLDAVLQPELGQLAEKLDETGGQALAELQEIIRLAGEPEVQADLSVVRGLSYYTGMVFECSLQGAEGLGSVLSGGRYDGMVGTFLNRQIPAVGASLGVDRCLAALERLGLLPVDAGKAELAVLAFPECEEGAFALAARLRQQNIPTVFLPVEAGKVGQALKQADQLARQAVLVGSRELESGRFTVRDLSARSELSLSEAELIDRLTH